MLAMFRKDLRELAKWAALILLGMAAAIVLVRWATYRDHYLLSGNANATSSIGCAIGGLLLGLMATVFEARRDSWGFLIHRPATRHRLFAGKALAAVVLLWLAAGIPLAASLWWESSPNRRSTPFAWSMGLGNLADLLAGTAYVFCGMAIGIRGAKWYGSRVLPLAGGLLASALSYLFPDFLAAAAAVLAVLAIAAAAAWGVFVAGGQDGSTPRIGKAGLGFCVYLALAALMLTAAAFVVGCVIEPLSRREVREFRYARYDVGRNGQVLRVTGNYYNGGMVSFEVTDLQGRPVPAGDAARPDSKDYTDRMAQWVNWTQLPPYVGAYFFPLEHYRAARHYYSDLRVFQPESFEQWQFNRRTRRIEVYDAHEQRRVGTLGANGFVYAGNGLARPFAEAIAAHGSYLAAFPSAAYRLNGKSRQLEQAFAAPVGESIAEAQIMGPGNDGLGDFVGPTQVVTQQAIYINDPRGKTVVRVPRPEWRGARTLRIAKVADEGGWLVMLDVLPSTGERAGAPSRLLRFDADGKQVSALDLPGLPATTPPAPAGMAPVFGILMTPAAATGGALFVRVVAGEQAFWEDLRGMSVQEREQTWQVVWWTVGSVLTAAAASWWLATRYGFSRRRRIVWAAACLFLGLAGVLLLLCLNERIARRKCHACGRQRMVTHELCEHCGAAWGAIERDGTEIMQEMAASENEPTALPTAKA